MALQEPQVSSNNTHINVSSFAAMATSVVLTTVSEVPDHNFLLERVKEVFCSVELQCSRFIESSDLSLINSNPQDWNSASQYCYEAISEAFQAYQETHGLFDPRILNDLVRLGYEKSFTQTTPPSHSKPELHPRKPLPNWEPLFRKPSHVLVGDAPIDLGGIGKGLALRWAADKIKTANSNFLIEAGGDCICVGNGPENQGWNIGVQNPLQPDSLPTMVLALSNGAVCTSSVAIRQWWRNGELKHHLISPSTGEPGQSGLLSVTVVSRDPAKAETWSKTLFLIGSKNIREASESNDLAATWVLENGEVETNGLISSLIKWKNHEYNF